MKHRCVFAALAAAAFLFPIGAQAASPSDADRATARALAAEAHRAFDEKDYATAAEKFARADALVHAPTLMLGLARSQAALGKIVAANESLNRIVREGIAPNSPKVFADAVEEARKELVTLTPRLSWITVNVNGAAGHEDTLKVQVDGVDVPAAAIGVPRAADSGRHVATATFEGGTRAEGNLIVEEGKSQTVTLTVKVDPNAVPVPKGTSTSPSTPGPGPNAGPPPPPPSPVRKTAGFVSLGVGGAGLLMGAITGGAVIAMHGSLAKDCPGGVCGAAQDSKRQTYNQLGIASTVGFIAGGTLAALGIVLVVTAPKQDAPTVGVSLATAPGGGALGVVGSF